MKSVALTLRLEEDIYTKVKEIARSHKTSFTSYVQSVLSEVLKNEEQKALYNAFTLVGQDPEVSDVEFATPAQHKVVTEHE